MADPVSLQVLDTIKTRLDAISVTGGYNTDPTVILGFRRVNDDQLSSGPVITVYDLADEPSADNVWGDEPIHLTQTIIVEGIVDDSSDQGLDLAHLLYQDIYNAALTSDRTLSGLTLDFGYAGRTMEYPEPGGNRIGVQVNFTALIEQPYGNL